MPANRSPARVREGEREGRGGGQGQGQREAIKRRMVRRVCQLGGTSKSAKEKGEAKPAKATTETIKWRTFSFGMPACIHGLAFANPLPLSPPAVFNLAAERR